jgi:hypothetical protein
MTRRYELLVISSALIGGAALQYRIDVMNRKDVFVVMNYSSLGI